MMGVAFSLIPAVMWPSVAYIVEEKRLGTAYALMTLVQQIGVAGMNWLIGRANDAGGASAANPGGYVGRHVGLHRARHAGPGVRDPATAQRAGPRGHGLDQVKRADA